MPRTFPRVPIYTPLTLVGSSFVFSGVLHCPETLRSGSQKKHKRKEKETLKKGKGNAKEKAPFLVSSNNTRYVNTKSGTTRKRTSAFQPQPFPLSCFFLVFYSSLRLIASQRAPFRQPACNTAVIKTRRAVIGLFRTLPGNAIQPRVSLSSQSYAAMIQMPHLTCFKKANLPLPRANRL